MTYFQKCPGTWFCAIPLDATRVTADSVVKMVVVLLLQSISSFKCSYSAVWLLPSFGMPIAISPERVFHARVNEFRLSGTSPHPSCCRTTIPAKKGHVALRPAVRLLEHQPNRALTAEAACQRTVEVHIVPSTIMTLKFVAQHPQDFSLLGEVSCLAVLGKWPEKPSSGFQPRAPFSTALTTAPTTLQRQPSPDATDSS